MNQQIRQAKSKALKARHTKSIEVAGDVYGCHSKVAPHRLKAQILAKKRTKLSLCLSVIATKLPQEMHK